MHLQSAFPQRTISLDLFNIFYANGRIRRDEALSMIGHINFFPQEASEFLR